MRQLKAFVAVATELHFGRASERLHMLEGRLRMAECPTIPSCRPGVHERRPMWPPDHPGWMILWVSASALYGVRQHPEDNAAQIILDSRL